MSSNKSSDVRKYSSMKNSIKSFLSYAFYIFKLNGRRLATVERMILLALNFIFKKIILNLPEDIRLTRPIILRSISSNDLPVEFIKN